VGGFRRVAARESFLLRALLALFFIFESPA
jgi:hypothetical protein